MKKIWLLMTLLLVLVCASPQLPKAAAFADRPVYFLVYDQSQEMDQSTFSSWRQMVKMVYHFPDYKLATETQAARTQARELLSNYSATDKANLQAIAKKIGADVVVVAVVHEMSEETIMDGFYGWSDPGEYYVRTRASADLYAYNANGDKFSKRKLREYDIKDMGLQEHPADTIKWALGRLMSRMEGKPEV